MPSGGGNPHDSLTSSARAMRRLRAHGLREPAMTTNASFGAGGLGLPIRCTTPTPMPWLPFDPNRPFGPPPPYLVNQSEVGLALGIGSVLRRDRRHSGERPPPLWLQ